MASELKQNFNIIRFSFCILHSNILWGGIYSSFLAQSFDLNALQHTLCQNNARPITKASCVWDG